MNSVQYHLLPELQAAVNRRLSALVASNSVNRLWEKDPFLWCNNPEDHNELANRLGWLHLPEEMNAKADALMSFATEHKEAFSHFLLMGMGGSSLAPEVLQKVLGNKEGFPSLILMDSTHPGNVADIQETYDLSRTLGIVASKSGGTAETTSFFNHFYSLTGNNGKQFIAITDPDTKLEKLASDSSFLHTFSSPPEVGGRYSALCEFGMVPAALLGADVHKFLSYAQGMANSCKQNTESNPGLMLGVILGEAAAMGTDKITFVTSPTLTPFPQWIEQLIAESTGKHGKGILPIADEILSADESFGKDRLFVFLKLAGEDLNYTNEAAALQAKGISFVEITVAEQYSIAEEFFRWEFATAVSGIVLGINPFDQPDVQLAKTLANESMAQYKETKSFAPEQYLFTQDGVSVSGDTSGTTIEDALHGFLGGARPGEYIALMAFLPYRSEIADALRSLAGRLRHSFGLPVTVGFGPRFLHSTGQLHKGGANNGYFIQIIDDLEDGEEIPHLGYSFGALITAQARGDYHALVNKSRRCLKIRITGDTAEGIDKIRN